MFKASHFNSKLGPDLLLHETHFFSCLCGKTQPLRSSLGKRSFVWFNYSIITHIPLRCGAGPVVGSAQPAVGLKGSFAKLNSEIP